MYPSLTGKKGKITGILLILIIISVYPFLWLYWLNLGDFKSDFFSFVSFNLIYFLTDVSGSEAFFLGFFYGLWSGQLAEMSVFPLKFLVNEIIVLIPLAIFYIILGIFYYPKQLRLYNPLYNIDNLIMEHKSSGKILWTYCFLRMTPNFLLPSGLISMVRVFIEEMQRTDVDRYEKSDIGTLLRVDGERIAITGIMRNREYVVPSEEKKIRDIMTKFVTLVESELATELQLLGGSINEPKKFEQKLFDLLNSVMNLQYIENLQKTKVSWLQKQRIRLKKKLEKLSSRFEELETRFKKGKIKQAEYENKKRWLEWTYNREKREFTYTILFLSRISPDPKKPYDKNMVEEVERVRNKFYKLWYEVHEMGRKKICISKKIEQKEMELFKLIKTLDKYMDEYLSAINVISN